LIFPGCEDFGIVPVEAQACGTPVIAFGQGGAAETIHPATIATRGTGILFREQSAESLGRAIDWFESHPEQFSAALAHRLAAQFNGERFKRQVVAYLQSIIGRDLPGQATNASESMPLAA
jgi:glycosyltransferase involved in cell wall biosynthesis